MFSVAISDIVAISNEMFNIISMLNEIFNIVSILGEIFSVAYMLASSPMTLCLDRMVVSSKYGSTDYSSLVMN